MPQYAGALLAVTDPDVRRSAHKILEMHQMQAHMAGILAKYIEGNKLQVRIIPNSSKNEIVGWDPEKKELRIKINALPEKNKANTELLKFLKKELKRPVEIVKGLKSRTKTILIH